MDCREHRLEFKGFWEGVEQYRCLDCGETVTQYQDTQGG